jgi:hypothetical protein
VPERPVTKAVRITLPFNVEELYRIEAARVIVCPSAASGERCLAELFHPADSWSSWRGM